MITSWYHVSRGVYMSLKLSVGTFEMYANALAWLI